MPAVHLNIIIVLRGLYRNQLGKLFVQPKDPYKQLRTKTTFLLTVFDALKCHFTAKKMVALGLFINSVPICLPSAKGYKTHRKAVTSGINIFAVSCWPMSAFCWWQLNILIKEEKHSTFTATPNHTQSGNSRSLNWSNSIMKRLSYWTKR